MANNEPQPSADSFREELKSEYEKDFELKERLDNKASNIVTMTGLVSAIFTGLIIFILKDAIEPNLWLLIPSIIALVIELIFLIKTIHSSMSAMKMADFKHVII